MNLTTVDKLLLIALNDEKGTFQGDAITFNYGLAGAIIYVLTREKRIEISNGKIRVLHTNYFGDETLDYCLKKIEASKKDRSPKYWIDHFGNRGSNIRKFILQKLMISGILTERESKILWIIPNNKYPSKNSIPENSIKRRLNDIVLRNVEPEVDEIMLLSLVDSCKLHKEVFQNKLKKEDQKRIKNIITNSELADDTHKLLKEIHDSIVAAIVVLMATTTITSAT